MKHHHIAPSAGHATRRKQHRGVGEDGTDPPAGKPCHDIRRRLRHGRFVTDVSGQPDHLDPGVSGGLHAQTMNHGDDCVTIHAMRVEMETDRGEWREREMLGGHTKMAAVADMTDSWRSRIAICIPISAAISAMPYPIPLFPAPVTTHTDPASCETSGAGWILDMPGGFSLGNVVGLWVMCDTHSRQFIKFVGSFCLSQPPPPRPL